MVRTFTAMTVSRVVVRYDIDIAIFGELFHPPVAGIQIFGIAMGEQNGHVGVRALPLDISSCNLVTS